jgi:hypothetical protein
LLQLNLNLPNTVQHDHDEPRSLNRGVVFLALAVLGWAAVWVAVLFVKDLLRSGAAL